MGVFSRLARLVSGDRPVLQNADASALPGLSLYDQYTRIGGGLTPAEVSGIFRDADIGYKWRLVDLGNEARQKDGHLQGILEQRESALGPLQLQVDPFVEPGASKPKARDVKIAEALGRALKGCKGLPPKGGMRAVGFQHLKKHLQGGNFWGYAMAETAWQLNREGLLAPAGFFCHSPRRFGFRDTDGALVQWDQVGARVTNRKIEVQQEWPGRWIQHQPRINGDVPAREGYASVLIWAAIFRNWDIADLMKLAEMTWKPYRIGKYAPQASDKNKAILLDALRSLTNNGIGLFPSDVEYELKWPDKGQSSGSNHLGLAEFLGGEMSKTVLHGTLLTQAGDRGARSLGEVHERGFDSVVEDDSGNAAETVERDVATWFVRWNYSETAGIPTISLVTQDEADLSAFSAGLKTLVVDVGMKVPTKWAYDRTGIPKPEEGEDVLGEDTMADLEAQVAAAKQAPPEPEPEPEEEPEPAPEPVKPTKPAKPEPARAFSGTIAFDQDRYEFDNGE